MTFYQALLASKPYFNMKEILSSEKSTIILASSTKDSKDYVLKIFGEDENSNQVFVHENSVHSSLRHPHIIQYYQEDTELSRENFKYNIIAMEHAPYGDFFDLVMNYKLFRNEKLIRTYFHQLIEGIQYLHSNSLAHLDLKLENLLLGEDLLLKIADFELAQRSNNNNSYVIEGAGSINYRAPEVLSGNCVDYYAADMYSIGICLYALMTGSFPFLEKEQKGQKKITLFRYYLFATNNEKFWRESESLIGGRTKFSSSLKELLNGLWAKKPRARMTLEDIKKSQWYTEPVYTYQELKAEMNTIFSK